MKRAGRDNNGRLVAPGPAMAKQAAGRPQGLAKAEAA